MVAWGFGSAVAVGTGLLSLPFATESGHRAGLVDALFTATSAVCVTGLVTVDTGGYWSGFGEGVILALIQAGGLGIMTLATLFTLLVTRRLRFRTRLVAQVESKSLSLTNLGGALRRIILFSLASEAVAIAILTVRFAVTYHQSIPSALYNGLFHGVSAFNNAGFSPHSDNLIRYVGDPVVSLVIAAAAILGGLGFPVVFELRHRWRRPSRWSVLTRLTITVTGLLLLTGTLAFLAAEYDNDRTLGRLSGGKAAIAAFFASAMTRTAGFNSIDIGAMKPESLLVSDVLMFIGGGSAGTAGGIKVTTFALLAFVIWSEARGEPHVNLGRRSISPSNQRQALAIVLISGLVVLVATFTLLSLTSFQFDQVLFEVISAFATVGLSTGITPSLPPSAHLILAAVMFIGRVGPLALASALALRERTRRFELPTERLIVG